MKKLLIIFITLFTLFLSACGNQNQQKLTINNDLAPISTNLSNGVFVGVSDPHVYSHKGPKLLSGTYYFNPRTFYNSTGINNFAYAYVKNFDKQKVYYYDDIDGANAGMVVYILRNIYHKKNVSLLLNSELKNKLDYSKGYQLTGSFPKAPFVSFASGYIGNGKYLVVYNPEKINFKTGDLLLYASDTGTMKLDNFYKDSIGLNIKNIDWTKLVSINGDLNNKNENYKFLSNLNLDKYKRVFIYYPKYWYRSGMLALYLQENY